MSKLINNMNLVSLKYRLISFVKNIYYNIPLNIRTLVFSPTLVFIRRIIWRKRRVCYGKENPDKTFYIIRYRYMGGLFGLMNFFIPHIHYAISMNFIPIIDMQNYRNMYLDDEQFRLVNAWENYFFQPSNVSLHDIAKSKNIILCCAGGRVNEDNGMARFVFDCQRIQAWHQVYKKYVLFNTKTSEYIEKEYNLLFGDGVRVVGCLCRGTDYLQKKPKNHPIQPEPDMVIEKVEEVMKKYHCKKVFIATEDQAIFNQFYDRFGDDVITNQHILYKETKDRYLSDIKFTRDKNAYYLGLEYLTTIALLSRCCCLVAGITGGSIAAMYMTEGFEYSYFFDLGLYP